MADAKIIGEQLDRLSIFGKKPDNITEYFAEMRRFDSEEVIAAITKMVRRRFKFFPLPIDFIESIGEVKDDRNTKQTQAYSPPPTKELLDRNAVFLSMFRLMFMLPTKELFEHYSQQMTEDVCGSIPLMEGMSKRMWKNIDPTRMPKNVIADSITEENLPF